MLGTRASQLRIHPVILRRPCAYRARSEAADVQNAIQRDPTRLTASRAGEIVGVPLPIFPLPICVGGGVHVCPGLGPDPGAVTG